MILRFSKKKYFKTSQNDSKILKKSILKLHDATRHKDVSNTHFQGSQGKIPKVRCNFFYQKNSKVTLDEGTSLYSWGPHINKWIPKA